MAARRRLDAELVRRELASSRELARRWIDERQVTVNGAIAQKAATMVAPGDAVEVLAPPPRFVGRGGEKMLGALQWFDVDPTGLRCVDVGSSTGGFTDCLLQEGATSVVAIDVGRAQLHERLRGDPRVVVREQTDVRQVDLADVGAPFDLVVIDVSFIGLARILDSVIPLAGARGRILALVKPQFEAGRSEADKGKGIIRDPAVWTDVLQATTTAASAQGLGVLGVGVSPIKGGAGRSDGNVEFFLDLVGSERDQPTPLDEAEIAVAIINAVTVAEELP
ncbi:MAG: TlyA family RNA methyltransferase [Actinomycetota bacterium]